MPVMLGMDVSGVVHAFRSEKDRYPVCTELSWKHPATYVAETHLANRPPQGRPITCLWCTLAVMRGHV